MSPSADSQLEVANAQLLRYAEDMRALLCRIAQRDQQLEQAQNHLEAYARDLEVSLAAVEQRAQELESAHHDTVFRLMSAAKIRDCETGIHLQRISRLTGLLATHLGFSAEETHLIEQAAALHDIGKIGIEDAILRKRGTLSPQEWETMKRHTIIGSELLAGSPSPLLQRAQEIALCHHERWDGSGYPYGLARDMIPLHARMVMLCDQYDALRSLRPYKPAYSHEAVCNILLQGDRKTRPQHFDPRLLDVFREIHSQFKQTWTELQELNEETDSLASLCA